MNKGEIILQNFNGYWKNSELSIPSLSNLNIKFEGGRIYGITGKVGSGKSGLLATIL